MKNNSSIAPARTAARPFCQGSWLLRAIALVAVLAAGNLSITPSLAAGTDPALALESVQAIESSSGAVSLQIGGRFQFDDVVQFAFPVGLFVSRGQTWVRYGLEGDVFAGTDAAASGGIAAGDVLPLLAEGAPAGVPAALLRVLPERITVALPASFGAGPASVVLYAVLEGEGFVSNSVAVTIP